MGFGNEVFTPTRQAPTGVNTRTVCEMLGMRMPALLALVKAGSLPPPVMFAGEMLWPIDFTADVHRNGLRLPGTFPGFPPGCDPEAELARWRLAGSSGHLRYTAAGKARARKAAKKGGRK